jgi:hypothetical protein
MELFLNILFAVIAIEALIIWRIDWSHQERQAPRKALQEWTAFVCALVFIFFAVSLSDDLRADAILTDACSKDRRHALVWDSSHATHADAHQTHAAAAAVPVHAIFCENLRVAGRIVPVPAHVDRSLDKDPCVGRSPPLSVNS